MKPSTRWALILALAVLGVFLVFRRSNTQRNAPAGKGVEFQGGKTKSRNSLVSSTSSSSSDNACFTARRILFLTNSNPHPLSPRINALVAEGLRSFPAIDSVETAPRIPSQWSESPDLFLQIDLEEVTEEGIIARSLKGRVTASLSGAPWQSHHHTQSRGTPPLVQFRWRTTLDHESDFSGIRSDRYGDPARSIAGELLKGITNQLSDLAKNFPPLPELPKEFYGPYEPVEDFPLLKVLNATRAYSYAGLFTRNETFWKFQVPPDPVPQLQRIIDQLEPTPWKLDSSSLTNTPDFYLRFRQKDAELEIFRLRPERINPIGPVPTEPIEFIVHYQKSFSDPEREAALEKLFTANASLETLLPFQNSFFAKQRERYYALLEKSPASSPRGYLQMADVYLRRMETNAALGVLLRAKALQATLDSPDLTSEIDTIAKKISPKEKLTLNVSPEIYRDLGFVEITNTAQSFELEIPFGQPVLMFSDDGRGPQTFCLKIGSPQKGSYPWSVIRSMEHSRSSSSSQFTLPPSGEWRQTFTFENRTLDITARLTPEKNGFRYQIETK